MVNKKNGLTIKLYVILILLPLSVYGRVLSVGPGKPFPIPSMAAEFANDGDIIEIDANGNYENDFAIWKQNNLTITGINGKPHINVTKLSPNKKGVWVFKGNDARVSNIEISGAKVNDKNGAALRIEGNNFQINDCYIHHNENGILTANKQPNSTVIIERCEFAFNGYGKGYTHNIYIGSIGKFILSESYTHDANKGHTIKSRARENYILYNRIIEGKASYGIDLPNGGYAIVMGNILHQDDRTDNWAMLSFGQEKYKHKDNNLEVVYNTFVNERTSSLFVNARKGGKVTITNNLFSGNGEIIKGMENIDNNFHKKDLVVKLEKNVALINPKYLPSILDKAVDVYDFRNKILVPKKQFDSNGIVKRPLQGNRYDLGAYEYPASILDILQ